MKRGAIPTETLRASAYKKRNQVLRELGYADYAEYLASPLWKTIRARVLARSPRCHVCDEDATQCHHASYKRAVLTGESVDRIFGLCRGCHEWIEFDAAGEKLSPQQATEKMHALRSRRLAGKKLVREPVKQKIAGPVEDSGTGSRRKRKQRAKIAAAMVGLPPIQPPKHRPPLPAVPIKIDGPTSGNWKLFLRRREVGVK